MSFRYFFYCFSTMILFSTSFHAQKKTQFFDEDDFSDDDEIVIATAVIVSEVQAIEGAYDDPDALVIALEGYKADKSKFPLLDYQINYINNAIARAEEGAGPAYYVDMIIGATGIIGVRKISGTFDGTEPATGAFSASLTEISNSWLNFVKGMQLFSAILFIIVIGIGVFKLFLNPGQTVISQILIRPILFLCALTLYSSLVDLLIYDPVEIIVKSLYKDYDVKSSELVKGFSDMLIGLKENADSANQPGGFFQIIKNAIMNAIFWLILIVVKSVIAYVFFMGTCLSAIYFALGPLAITLSLIPGNEKVLEKWFYGFLSYLLWQPILILIMMITVASFSVIQTTMGTMSVNAILSLCLCVGVIFFLLMTPKISNLLVAHGSEAGHGMVSNAAKKAGKAAMKLGKKAVTKGMG